MSATPKQPKVRPVTRWMVAFSVPDRGWILGKALYGSEEECDVTESMKPSVRAIRAPITPVPPSKKAKKGGGG